MAPLDINTFPMLPADEHLREDVRALSPATQKAFMLSYIAQACRAARAMDELNKAVERCKAVRAAQ